MSRSASVCFTLDQYADVVPEELDEAGEKLSKSTQATALRALRAAGATPADVRRLVGLAPSL